MGERDNVEGEEKLEKVLGKKKVQQAFFYLIIIIIFYFTSNYCIITFLMLYYILLHCIIFLPLSLSDFFSLTFMSAVSITNPLDPPSPRSSSSTNS